MVETKNSNLEKMEQRVVSLYRDQKKNLKETAAEVFGKRDDQKVKEILAKHGVELRGKWNQNRTSLVDKLVQDKQLVNQIFDYYVIQKHGLKSTGAHFGYSYTTIQQVLKKSGIPLHSEGGELNRKYKINTSFFSTQSANLGYVIGILGSDGCVAANTNQVYIELQRADREILEKINEAIGNERPVQDYETARGYLNSKLYFHSKEIKQILAEYHIIPNKTYNENHLFPEKLDKKYWIDYIRGYFDGDGSIKQHDKHGITWQIDTNKNIAASIQKVLSEEYGIQSYIYELPKVNVTLYRIQVQKKEDVEKLFSLMYYDGVELFMQRKVDRFIDLLSK